MEQYVELWSAVLEELNKKISSVAISLWLGKAELTELTETEALITLPDKFKRGMVEKRYADMLSDAFENVLGFKITLRFTSVEEQIPSPEDVLMNYKPRSDFENEDGNLAEDSNYIAFSSEYTFENFIVGGSNKFAHAACIAVASHPSTEYNPLFIYGSSGLGKTHLLNAIMNQISKNNPNMNIIYVKGEDFTNQMIDSIAHKSQEQFRAKYRKADVLLVDDIQFIAGKDSTQEEFFHTFNALYEAHKQIIMTSDRPPKDIKTLEERLRTRFDWGLIADIQPPDFELRIAIMRNKAKNVGLNISDEVCKLIAENLKSNIRQIEGAIKRICARSLLNGEPITVEMARECIGAYISADEPPQITSKKIVSRVSKKYGISEDDIYGRKRSKPIANARNISMYIIRKLTDMTLVQIAQTFDRDHSTVMSAIKAVQDDISANPLFEIEINDLIKEITE